MGGGGGGQKSRGRLSWGVIVMGGLKSGGQLSWGLIVMGGGGGGLKSGGQLSERQLSWGGGWVNCPGAIVREAIVSGANVRIRIKSDVDRLVFLANIYSSPYFS